MKHLEVRQKYSAALRIFNSLLGVSSGDETLRYKPLERVHSIKLLGVHMTDILKWDDHVKHLAPSCYGVLAAMRKIKNFTNYHLRKHLVECLVLSRLDFNDIIFYPITDCPLKRLQRIQFAAASFVFGRYVNNIDSILKLGRLPMKERLHTKLYTVMIGPETFRLSK